MNITSVTTKEAFLLELTYDNGEVREFDTKPLLEMKPWNKLKNHLLFQQAKPFYNAVIWPGEIDVAPETLYLDSRLVSSSEI